jgi:hypothetical protein
VAGTFAAVCVVMCPPAVAQEPGVHVNPQAPASVEYAVPLVQARGEAAGPTPGPMAESGRGEASAQTSPATKASSDGRSTPLFGVGVGPRSGAAAGGRAGAAKAAGAGKRGDTSRSRSQTDPTARSPSIDPRVATAGGADVSGGLPIAVVGLGFALALVALGLGVVWRRMPHTDE